ncbi:hypothetical protein CONCODRAFT_78078 [Conidiobolus coronatus NRRL 28638]|uniref:PIPK domain-containing protein n=1 Tax=Conidiobolus coronatus (strain ATCC 28846 / CBS 209.66 / NRRL 28638) TaxID=796925 RepID=A0A137PA70_CONC2|nr:hypothetical protein CONCODRAFT_78078 [Conidiobolus coronatus NRRL 28638]|eukprot:KXN71909.1 hypothetical protein CONCODRAFT_78078 [Conidiobolus coronatus NRRL 28638]
MVTSQNTDNLESPRLLDGLTFQKNQLEIELSLQKSHLTILEEHYDQMKSSELLMKAMEFPISPFSHQSITILYCNVFVSENLICQAPQKHTIDYYQESDMSLGQFLEELCFDTSVICGTCDQSFFSHLRSYVHGDARMTITVQQLACPLPGMEDTILMWNYCLVCQKSLLVVPMSQETYKYSFGKYLELMFYHTPSTCRADLCPHDIHKDHVRYFGHRNLAARFQYEKIDLLDVNVPPTKLNFKPSISTKLKNEDYEKLKASINSYWDSVNEKLKSLMVYSMSIEKHDTCREELLEMARRVGAERTYILQVLEQTFLNSHPTDTLALNLVLRVMQEKVAEWDGEFADIIDKYLQTEKDLRRLTAVQIRKLFPDKDEAPAPIPDDLSVNAEEVQEVSEDEPIQYQEPSALGPIYPTLGGSPSMSPTDELPINPLEISLDHTFGNLYQPVMDGRTYRRYSLKHMQDDHNSHSQELSKETLKPSDNLITPQKIDEKEQHDFHMYKPHLKNSDLPKVVSTIKSSGTPFLSKMDSTSSTHLPLANKFFDKSKDYNSLRRSNTTTVPLFSPVPTPKQLVIKQPTIGEGTIGSNTAKRMAARAASKAPLDKPLLKADKNIKLKYNLRSAEDRMSDSHRYAYPDTNERGAYSKDSVSSVDRRIKRSQTTATPAGRINRPRAMTRPVIEVYSNPQDAVKDESDDEFSEPGSLNTTANYKQPKPAASANNLRATPNHRMHQTRTGPRIDINRNVKSSPQIPQLTPNTKIGSPDVLSESPGAYVSNSILTFLNNDMDMLPSPPKSPGKAEMPVMSSEDPFIKANSNINLNVPGIEIPNQDQADQAIESPEKLSIIKTFSNLWNIPTSPHVVPLEYPLQPTEHLFPDSLIVIREDEPSSVIAFTLSSQTYHDQLRFIRQNQYRSTESVDDSEEFSYDIESTLKQKTSTHLKYQLAEGAIKFSCKIFFAEQFDALRHYCDQDIMFIESLARCVKWQASGGKSGSIFLKTRDNRLIMKEVSRAELDAFLKFAPVYFSYLAQGFFEELPMMLAKIFGVYRIGFKNILTGKTVKLDVLIMENLFYERKISRIFDLKGSMRNRHVQSTGKENEVLLDENLMEIICRNPIFIRAHAKRLLHLAIHNDTLFLSKLNVMDYSLLVGIDEEQGELVVGIVDFIRTFTWDKKLESWVKESGFLGGGGEKPTILSPSNYKHRFRSFMEKYFLMVPDKYFLPGLDRKLK